MYQFSDFRLLNHFLVVYNQRSLSGAAEILHLSQPALSKSIKTLEYELNTSLFSRTSQGMTPTESADKLYVRATKIVFELDHLRNELNGKDDKSQHMANLGCGYIAWPLLNRGIQAYDSGNEDLTFNIHVSNARNLLDLNKANNLDLIIANKSTLELDDRLEIRELETIEIQHFARSGHPVFEEPESRRETVLSEYRFVSYHLLEDLYFRTQSVAPHVMANDTMALFDIVTGTDSYMAIPRSLQRYAAAFDIRPISGTVIRTNDIAVGWTKPEPPSYIESFLEMLVAGSAH